MLIYSNIYLLENDDCHVEMMMLHCGCGVYSSQRRPNVNHELVVEASMIKIVTERSNEHGQTLQHAELARAMFEDAVDAVGNMETMAPVMIGHRAVILLNCNEESCLEREIILVSNNFRRILQLPECCNQTCLSQIDLRT